ncbi:hypothetical protein [Actinophytocola sp.]|uniref:hypothetical protein n=1 Tax=Actinophytocola sp. TaxID=1872138 RepID=UPI003D6AB7EE
MTQPYGQQPGGNYPGSGGFQQPGGYPDSGGMQPGGGGLPQAPQAPGYQPGYQQGYGGMPQAPQEYSGGPVARPGVVTGAAVLAYIQAGITTITTILVWIGVANLEGGELALQAIVALAQTIGIVLLIWGGVQIMGGKGRTMLVAGAALELAICLVWLIRFGATDSGGIDFVEDVKAVAIGSAIFFAIMPVIIMVMALGAHVTQFLQSRRG